MSRKYRADRRNAARDSGIKFPWHNMSAKVVEAPALRKNARDRSEDAEARRAKHITIDFTDGVAGISRALINHDIGRIFKKKPKRKWAAARRRAPFEVFLGAGKLHKARMRHRWYRKQQEAAQ